ncbi:hypothetical protein [Lutibacter sp.]
MEGLELLKKSWKKQEDSFQQLSYNDIYKIIHKKSSSIVKWIFIISIAEFIFWGAINLLIPERVFEMYNTFNLKTALYISYVFHYIISIGFIVMFYKNFKSICVADSTSLLMKKIIRTRKTVNYYMYYNILSFVILSIGFNIVIFSHPDILMEVVNPDNLNIDTDRLFYTMLIVQLLTIVIMCGLFWIYYRIIYGILLKKLSKNYTELASLEL